MLLLKVNFIKRLQHTGVLYSFLHKFWKEAKIEEWASQLDIHKYELARFQAQSLNKRIWSLNSHWDYLKGSCQLSITISCKYRCMLLHCGAACQTPLKRCIRGSYSWDFSPQHSPCATCRWDGGQITVTVSLSYMAPLPPELLSLISKHLLGFSIQSWFFSSHPVFWLQAKIPARFISTVRKPHSSWFTLKLDLKCKPKSYW